MLKGFIVGLALTIIVGQLPKLFGVEKTSGNFFEQLWGLLGKLDETSGLTLLVGISSLSLVIASKQYAPVVPGSLAQCYLESWPSISSTSTSTGLPPANPFAIRSVASCTVLARSAGTPSDRANPTKSTAGSFSSMPT